MMRYSKLPTDLHLNVRFGFIPQIPQGLVYDCGAHTVGRLTDVTSTG